LSAGQEAEIAAWLKGRSERVIETACARVFLAGEVAWKLKRNVDLGYVDFSTREKRKWALDRELAFNRTAAPDIYRAVRTITREAAERRDPDAARSACEHHIRLAGELAILEYTTRLEQEQPPADADAAG